MSKISKLEITVGVVVTSKYPHRGVYEEAPKDPSVVAWRIESKSIKKGRVHLLKARVRFNPETSSFEPFRELREARISIDYLIRGGWSCPCST